MRNNLDIKSLYVHIPFCESLCDYCDFTKLQYFRIFASKYIKMLKKELESYHIHDQLETIYVGGGTPTSLEDDLFEELLMMLDPYTKHIKEYTFEANPESLSLNKIKLLKKYHVNRISLGVESTNDKILKSINRKHTFQDVIKVVNLLKENGFDNINIDLILGLPNCNKKLLTKDINNILSLNINHISCYGLTVHPHTVFYLKNILPPNDDELREMYDLINNKLKENNFIHYEISNWCLKNKESLHNLTYWKNNQYFAIGLSSSGYIGNIRYKNVTNLDQYLKGDFKKEEEIVTKKDKRIYYLMLNLRTIFGLDLNQFKQEFNEDLLSNQKINEYIKSGLLIVNNDHLLPSYTAMMTLDNILLNII